MNSIDKMDQRSPMLPIQDRYVWIIGAVASAVLYVLAHLGLGGLSRTEVLGFATGAACVWLTVRQNIWLWPVSIANNIFFIILFFRAKLFADMSLQFVYIVLEIFGWYWWLYGGSNRGVLHVTRTRFIEGLALVVVGIAATIGLVPVLRYFNDAAPRLDSLTTVMSLVAQYMLTRKLLENWYVWIAADVIYIGLYAYRGLYLTGVLYAVFLTMCLAGLREWRRSLQSQYAQKEAAECTAATV